MDSGEWVTLLTTPEERPARSRIANGGRGSSHDAARALRILENTPRGKVGVKKSKVSEVESLRGQVASLVKEKRDLSLRVSLEALRNSSASVLRLLRKLLMAFLCVITARGVS